jgi:capsular exopolysaccharide synthesis family protein
MTKNPNSFIPHDFAPTSITWQYLWTIGAPRLRLFFLCFLTAILLAIIYLIHAPRLYESTATVQVEQQEQRAFKSTDQDGDADSLKGDDVIKTIEQNLQNYSLFVKVVSDPKIANDPNFLVGYSGSTSPSDVADLAEWLQSNTKVVLRHGTRLIDVTVDHRVPAMAQKLAQAIIDSFLLLNGEAQNSTQQAALKFLVVQSEQMKANLQKSEDSLEIYKDSLLLKDRIDDQQRVIDALKQRYREKHPQLIQARMLLADLMQTFDIDFKKVMTNSTGEAAYWASNNNDLASASPADRIPTELKLVEARSEVLQTEVDTETALFDNILKQMRETDVSQDAAATEITVVEPPPLPHKPSKPKKAIVLLLGLAAGTLAGVVAIALSHAIDSSIQSPTEAEALLGLPVLIAIPRIPSKKKPGIAPDLFSFPWKFSNIAPALLSLPSKFSNPPEPPDKELVVTEDPSSAAAEAFRSLRAVIDLLGKAAEHRTILFTSALPGEGKTFVSCNHALALAQAGLTTLLVDTDLRRPSVHTRFKLENKIGFVEVVTQDLDLNEAVHYRVAKNLNVLTAGGKCPNPAELLAGSGFKETLTKALMNYDRVVFDCSPVNLVSDSLLIAGYVDTVCLVVRAASTARQAPLHAVTLLRRAQREPSGIILNAVPPWNDRLHLGYKSEDGGPYRQSYS